MTIFNKNYGGPAYSVKYLGIVDGTMGILSRKMALQNAHKENTQNNGKELLVFNPGSVRTPSMKPEFPKVEMKNIKPLLKVRIHLLIKFLCSRANTITTTNIAIIEINRWQMMGVKLGMSCMKVISDLKQLFSKHIIKPKSNQ